MFTYRLADDLVMRQFEDADAEELFAVADANRAHLRRWLPWVDGMHDVEVERQFIRAARERDAREDGFHSGIWEAGKLVGGIGFHYVNRPNRKTEIGYWLAENAQGRGIMTRACRAVVDHAFRRWSMNRVIIYCATENRRSRAIPERLGFTLEGTCREAEWLYDHFVDLAQYAMLAREWGQGEVME
jgi:ribosomal-protein-serine acetyltransferase